MIDNEGRYHKSEALLNRALESIPLGSQTFSKSKVQFPYGVSPFFIEKGKGSHVWDVDGNEYVDFMNGLLSVSIGYNDPEVTHAVQSQIENGVTFSLPHRLETEVSELLIDMIPCAEMVRFGKNGSDATSAAIRLARAFTGREHICVCGYHGWQDWYIGSTTRNLGVPESTRKLTHVFKYNDIGSLAEIFSANQEKISAVIIEPMNVEYPEDDFLNKVKELAHENGALLVFDETITGCRFAKGGGQELFNVIPDLATFGKGIANGFPLSAVLGRRDIMLLMEEIFYSGTFAGETASLAAAKVVLEKIRREPVVERLADQGQKVIDGVTRLIEKHDLGHVFSVTGHPAWSFLLMNGVGEISMWEIKTLFLQEMFLRGIITIGTHNMSYSHTDEDVKLLLEAYDEVLPLIGVAVCENNIQEVLRAETLKPLFKVR